MGSIVTTLMLQVGGLGILLVGVLATTGICCSEGSPVIGAPIIVVAVAVLLGGFVLGACIAALPNPVRRGMTWAVGSWAGAIVLAMATGPRPLVGVVFGLGVVMLMPAPRQPVTATAVVIATAVTAWLEVYRRSDRNGLVAVVLLAVIAATVLAPADSARRTADQR